MRVLTSDRLFARHVGGNSTYARRVYEGLTTHGIEHIPASPFSILRSRQARASMYALFEGVYLPRLARTLGADVLHFPGDTGAVVPSAHGTRTVATVHGVASRHVAGIRTRLQEHVWRSRVSALTRVADQIITVSNASADDVSFVFGVPPERLVVIPHGVDHAVFRPLSEAAAARELEGLGLPARFALYVGNIEPRKNLTSLVEAFEAEIVRNLGVPLVIAGRPAWNFDPLLQRIRQSPAVQYLGGVTTAQVAALMNKCSAFVFPSLYEGFGLPVLEAMACEAPVVTTRRGAIPEVAGDAVKYCNVTPASIAEAVSELLQSPAEMARLRVAGVARAAGYTWQASVAKHAHTFRKLL